jgi:BMFP domain-containing protein YqiC
VFGALIEPFRFIVGRVAALRCLVTAALPLYSAHRLSADFLLPFKLDPETLMDLRPLDDLAKKLAASVPESLIHLRADLENNFRSVLQSGLAKLDVVTRQEFDVQAGVLKRTREKLEALEARLAELEASSTK